MNQCITDSILEASKVIGKTWPLYSFVASNPLAGYEKASFQQAVCTAGKHLNAEVFPEAKIYRQAYQNGDIDNKILLELLKENGLSKSPEYYLSYLESNESTEGLNRNHLLDCNVAKWLASFMDEGLAEWDMPFKDRGFYAAWRQLVIYDPEAGFKSLDEIPESSEKAIEEILIPFKETEYVDILSYQLASLPGWTGYINHRNDTNSDWQQTYPITLTDYLAVRLLTAKQLKLEILPEVVNTNKSDKVFKVQYAWLQAWEQTWQNQLVQTFDQKSNVQVSIVDDKLPEAQMVFCIDTRSELIRRHIEEKGNYETFGYAGFFGIAMDYEDSKDGIIRKSCPPIVSSAYKVSEIAQPNKEKEVLAFERKNDRYNFGLYFLKRLKNMLPSAFGYVEGSGLFYGVSIVARTLMPGKMYQFSRPNTSKTESICQPEMVKTVGQSLTQNEILLEEKVNIVKSAFELLGWNQFAPLVLFVGHGSHSANNAFGSSLDCGACAASPGRHNARMLAKLANLQEVREELNEKYGIKIPDKTVFIGAEHNTTTDSIVLFDSEVSESHKQLVQDLKVNLNRAQQTATQDRLVVKKDSVATAQIKANHWAETRPEWGLAKNAGFIVGPRSLTKNTNLDSRCFLHSYDWNLDKSGKALEGIMQGPMVVTQWINNHYYFSTVDNKTFGGGSKITHNITGKFGVVQGNGGDLKMGLPLQSLFNSDNDMYHQPLRLTVMIQAPVNRVSEILLRNENLKTLLDNEWIYLMVMDPENENEIFQYKKSIQWVQKSMKKESKITASKRLKKEFEVELSV